MRSKGLTSKIGTVYIGLFGLENVLVDVVEYLLLSLSNTRNYRYSTLDNACDTGTHEDVVLINVCGTGPTVLKMTFKSRDAIFNN